MFKSLVTAVAITMAATLTAQAQQQRCSENYEEVIELLNSRYGEVSVGMGLFGEGILEILWNPKGKSFTILSIDVNGRTCLLTAGEDFEFHPGIVLEIVTGESL